MPITNQFSPFEGSQVHVWNIEEEEEELKKGIVLTPFCQNRVEGMKSDLHRKAFYSVRQLMLVEGYHDKDLEYNELGKPYLVDSNNISISHSHNYAGIVLDKNNAVGIDIEKKRDKILRIAHKFTPLKEYRSVANSDALIKKLTMVWCAKEAIYKIVSKRGLRFLDQIWVNDFNLDDTNGSAIVHYNGIKTEFDLAFSEFDGFEMAVARQKP